MSLWRTRGLRPLLAAEVISTTGGQMTWLALPWFVLVTSGSATRMSLVVAAELLGLAALGLPGGKLLGRFGAWRMMVFCDSVRAPLMLVVPLLHWAGGLSFAALLAIAAALGALSAPYFAAQKVIVPELLGEDEALVSRANALFQGATRMTMLLGPVAGGVLIAFLSAPVVLAVDAATYAVSAVILKLFVPRPQQLPAGDEDTGVRRGIRFLAREPLLRIWTPVFAFGDAAWTAFFISVPVLVVDRFGADPRVAGWLIASFGVGALLGNAVAFRFLLERVRGFSLIAIGVLGQALPLWLLTVDLPAAAYSAVLVASGLGNGLCNPSIHSLMTLRIPPALRPTVMTTMMMLFALVQPLAVFGVGPVLDAFGPEPVLVGFAAAQTVAMTAVAVSALAARSAAPAAARPVGAS
ncbi:MAG TPA: MFS transporter [Gaiellaceae bacterium]|nr:MFS transporter [Gaiellaceae bacterium]